MNRVSYLIPGIVVGLLSLDGVPSHAVDSCRARVRSSDGLIQVSATGVEGALRWGETPATCATSFFNDPPCVLPSGRARRCQLGEEGTAEAITPPADCTIDLCDDGPPATCFVPGCTPRRPEPPVCASGDALTWDGSTWQCFTPGSGGAGVKLYDSGWFSVGRNQDHTLSHGLGTTAVVGSVWFSKNSSGTDRFYGPAPLSWREHNPEFVSGATVASMNDSQVTLRTGNDFRIPTTSPSGDGHEVLSAGFARVVLMALD